MSARRQEKDGIKYIYALGRELGLSDPALGHDDDLHVLVEGVTGCSSIKELSAAELDAVIHELLRRKAAAAPETLHKSKKPRHYDEVPGRMTVKQQKYAWFLMSEIDKYPPLPRLLTLSNPSCRFSLWIEGGLVEVRIKEDGSIRGEDGAVFFWEGNGECCCFEIYPSSNAAVPPQKELALAAGGGVPYHRRRHSTKKDSA